MTSTDLPRVKLLEFQVRTTLSFLRNQVKLSRCLIYKVQSAVFEDFSELFEALCRSRWQLIHYIRSFSVCQELFSSFSNFFRPAPLSFESSFYILANREAFVKNFFVSFQNLVDLAAPHRSSLISILPRHLFVNTFLRKIFRFFYTAGLSVFSIQFPQRNPLFIPMVFPLSPRAPLRYNIHKLAHTPSVCPI